MLKLGLYFGSFIIINSYALNPAPTPSETPVICLAGVPKPEIGLNSVGGVVATVSRVIESKNPTKNECYESWNVKSSYSELEYDETEISESSTRVSLDKNGKSAVTTVTWSAMSAFQTHPRYIDLKYNSKAIVSENYDSGPFGFVFNADIRQSFSDYPIEESFSADVACWVKKCGGDLTEFYDRTWSYSNYIKFENTVVVNTSGTIQLRYRASNCDCSKTPFLEVSGGDPEEVRLWEAMNELSLSMKGDLSDLSDLTYNPLNWF